MVKKLFFVLLAFSVEIGGSLNASDVEERKAFFQVKNSTGKENYVYCLKEHPSLFFKAAPAADYVILSDFRVRLAFHRPESQEEADEWLEENAQETPKVFLPQEKDGISEKVEVQFPGMESIRTRNITIYTTATASYYFRGRHFITQGSWAGANYVIERREGPIDAQDILIEFKGINFRQLGINKEGVVYIIDPMLSFTINGEKVRAENWSRKYLEKCDFFIRQGC